MTHEEPARESTRRVYQERIGRALAYVHEHLDEPLALEDLARAAHFSPFHFHRIFRGLLGEAAGDLVRRLRLERAAMALRHSSRSVQDIALAAGYGTHEAFTRAFRAAYNQAPTEFRAGVPVTVYLASPSNVHYVSSEAYELAFVGEGADAMDVRVEDVPAERVACLWGKGPYGEIMPMLWQRFCQLAGPRGLLGPGGRFLSIFCDDPELTDPRECRSAACVTVDGRFKPEGELEEDQVGGGLYAIYTYKGPFAGIGAAWMQFCGQWIPQNGYEVRPARCYEVYLKDPNQVPPEEMVTELYEPVQRVG
jgi:AraC family transcriptional regulator